MNGDHQDLELCYKLPKLGDKYEVYSKDYFNNSQDFEGFL